MLPRDFPLWQNVYWWFRTLMRRFLFGTIHDIALMIDRERQGAKRARVVVSSTARRSRRPLPRPVDMTPGRRWLAASVISSWIRMGGS